MKSKSDKQKEASKAAIRKLTNVDNFMDELWHKVDNKELSKAISELREAINLINESWSFIYSIKAIFISQFLNSNFYKLI